MWDRIAKYILKNRFYLLLVIGLVTIFMGYECSKIQLDYGYTSMISENDPVNLDNIRFKEIFGEEDKGIVIAFVDSSFFDFDQFVKYKELNNRLKEISKVSSIISIPQAVDLRQVTTTNDEGKKVRQFETYPIFSDSISNQTELNNSKEEFYSLPIYRDLLYNKETHTYIMIVSLANEILNSKDRIPVVNAVSTEVEKFASSNNVELHISGHPYIRTKMMDMIKAEITLFIILAALICISILFIFFRSFNVIGVALLIVGIGVVWAMGLMSLLEFKITVLTGMVPPLLIIIGIPNIIFLLNKYHREIKLHGNKIKALQRVVSKIGNAVFFSNLTTAIGFSTFIITNSSLLVDFGIIASLGILFVFLAAIICIPAIFSFLDLPPDKHTKHLNNKIITRIVNLLTKIISNYRKALYVITSIILLFCFYEITQIKRTGYILDDVPNDAPIAIDLRFIEKNFKGISPIEILIESKDSLNSQKMINQISKLSDLQYRLSQYPELSKSVSIADAVKFLNQAYTKGDEANYKLPENPKTYETIFNRLPTEGANKILKSFIDSTNTITRISLNIADLGTDGMKKILPKIKNDINEVFPQEEYKTLVTGSTILYFTGTTYLIKNLATTLCLAIVAITFLMYLLQRSIKMVIISLVPNIIPILVTAMLMGLFGIPIKPSTILVFGIALGISVDGTIHYIIRYRQELSRNKWNMSEAVYNSLRETGTSLMYTAAILFFGFLIFTFSDFGGTIALGFLISMTLLTSMICNLIILPSLILSFEKYLTRKTYKRSSIKFDYNQGEPDEHKL